MGVHGSISVARALLAADVVDELRLVIAPTIVGSGQGLFGRVAARTARDDPQRCLTQWSPSRRLPRGPLGAVRAPRYPPS
ncbi:dihydrofolate reductase family protein [Actinopolymorpha pittospori]